MKITTQYCALIPVTEDVKSMPDELRAELDRRLDAIEMHVAGVEVKREFVWLPACPRPGDPLGQRGWAGAKLFVECEVDRESYLAALRVEGWRPCAESQLRGVPVECRDVQIDGRLERWVRPAQPEAR